jgi:hypothetical protein
MSTHTRRWPVVVLVLALALATAAAAALLPLAEDPLEAACRRVPLGADEEAVAEAVGRPPDGVIGESGRTAEVTRRVLYWEQGEDQLLVEFDEGGRAVEVGTYRWEPTRWQCFRAWLGW